MSGEKEMLQALIKALRHKSSLSQKDFANKYGLCRVSVANYEVGKQLPRADVLIRMIFDFHPHLFSLLQDLHQEYSSEIQRVKKCRIQKLRALADKLEGEV